MCTNRHYYRCVDCLTVSAADEYLSKADCGVCGGAIEWMGRVQRQSLVKEEIQCACDARCTFARGPSCDCHCGGVNHGLGVLVVVVREVGKVPRLSASGDGKKAATVAADWRRALAAITAAVDQLLTQHRELGNRFPYEEYRKLTRLQAYRFKARKSRSHRHRIQAIAEALPDYQAATVEPLQAALFS